MTDTSSALTFEEALRKTASHLDAFENEAALAVIDAALAAKSGAPPASATLQRVRALFGLERFQLAESSASTVLRDASATPLEVAQSKELIARVLSRWGIDLDYAIDFARTAATFASRPNALDRDLLVRARSSAAVAFGRKRVRGAALAELEAARKVLGDDAALLAVEAWLALEFDDRTRARDLYAQCAAMGPVGERFGRIGLARVARLHGDFDLAHQELDRLGVPPRGDMPQLHERAMTFAAQGRWTEAASAYDAIVNASPFADAVRWTRNQTARSLLKAGQRDEAVRIYEALASSGDDAVGKTARRNLERLAAAGARDAKKSRLQSFPSVAQLRDHCGPASCELYLQHFGIPADQVEIARSIKKPGSGTPVYAMREFLENAGLQVRRVEADLPRMKWIIDQGIPLIIEEEYSTTRHVAVAIGYDDEREILEVQDPMTHELRETHYEDLPRLLALANNGAIIAFAKDDETRRAAFDAAGVTEAAYIALTDQAWKAVDEKRHDDASALCAQAIAIRKDYELAWMCKFELARIEHDKAKSDATARGVQNVLDEILAIWPDDEWPQQYVGSTLFELGRYSESMRAYSKARDRDKADANNWAMIGECMIALGGDDPSRPLYEALRLMPWHRRANENLADILEQRNEVGRARALNDAARELSPTNPFNFEVQARLLEKANETAAALAAYEKAMEVDPKRGHSRSRSARLLAMLGCVEDAVTRMRPLIESNPDNHGYRIDLADLLYAHGRPDLAVAECEAILAKDEKVTSAHAILGAALAATGKLDDGIASMRKALRANPAYSWVYAEMAKHLLAQGRAAEAAESAAAATGIAGNDSNRFLLAMALADAGAVRDAAGRLRYLMENSNLSESELVRATGVLLRDDSLGSAHDLFGRLAKKRENDVRVIRAHVHLLLERGYFPRAAKGLLEKLEELLPSDPLVAMQRGSRLLGKNLASEAEGEALLRASIEAQPSSRAPRIALAEALSARGRHEEALTTLEPCASSFHVQKARVNALLGLMRIDDARALANEERNGSPPSEALELRLLVAQHTRDFKTALELAESLIRAGGENEDDGKLDFWETKKFSFLLRLGDVERAVQFGMKQIANPGDASYLAHLALAAERPDVARLFAERSLATAPDDVGAVHVIARLTELAGDTEKARALWQKAASLAPTDHRGAENLARLLVGDGDANAAKPLAESAVEGGHLCPWSFAVRAQQRILSADPQGALSDLDRAWSLADTEDREQGAELVWALRAALQGDRTKAAELGEKYLHRSPPISSSDRARATRVLAAVDVPIQP